MKPIKAPAQYKPPVEETSLETSYSATFKGEQVKAHPTDNKLLERRRIRSLYSEPSKEAAKVRACLCRSVRFSQSGFLDVHRTDAAIAFLVVTSKTLLAPL